MLTVVVALAASPRSPTAAVRAAPAITRDTRIAVDPSLQPTVEFLERRVEDDPLDTVALNRLAATLLARMRATGKLSDVALAREAVARSLASIPAERNASGLAMLALVEYESHRFAEAAELARQVLALDEQNATALSIAADAALELGQYDDVERHVDRLAARGETLAALARRARMAELRGDDVLALELLSSAGSSDDWYRLRRAKLLMRAGRLDEAEAEIEAAARTFPMVSLLAELRAAEGRDGEAVRIYEDLYDASRRPDLLHTLGELHEQRGRKDEAVGYYRRAEVAYLESARAGETLFVHHLAGLYSDGLRNPEEAVRWARKDLEARRSIAAYDALAWALYRCGDFLAASEAISRAASFGTRDPHLMYHEAMIRLRTGEIGRAKDLLQEIARLGPATRAFHAHR